MLSTDTAPVSCRSNRDSFPATRTTDIPEREQSQGTKKQLYPMLQPQGAKVLPFEFGSGVAEATWCLWIDCDSAAWSLSCGSHGYQTTACQNAFLYRACASLLRKIHIGSPHSLGPWSVMQAALQGGAAISLPSIPCVCARVTLLWVRSRAVVGVASDSPSNSAAKRYLIFIVGLLDCGPRATRGAPELPWDKRMPVSGRMTGVRVGIFPNTQWNSPDGCGDSCRACSLAGKPRFCIGGSLSVITKAT